MRPSRPSRNLATECRPYTGTQTPLRCRPGPRADLSLGALCRFRDGQRAHVDNQPCIVELCEGANALEFREINRSSDRHACVALAETDCVAGHVGLELANPSASYLIGIL